MERVIVLKEVAFKKLAYLFLGLSSLTFSCDLLEDEPPVQEQVGDNFLDGGGGADCSNLSYNGPTNDGQLEAFCKYSQFLECAGLWAELNANCQVIRDYGWTGCPYC